MLHKGFIICRLLLFFLLHCVSNDGTRLFSPLYMILETYTLKWTSGQGCGWFSRCLYACMEHTLHVGICGHGYGQKETQLKFTPRQSIWLVHKLVIWAWQTWPRFMLVHFNINVIILMQFLKCFCYQSVKSTKTHAQQEQVAPTLGSQHVCRWHPPLAPNMFAGGTHPWLPTCLQVAPTLGSNMSASGTHPWLPTCLQVAPTLGSNMFAGGTHPWLPTCLQVAPTLGSQHVCRWHPPLAPNMFAGGTHPWLQHVCKWHPPLIPTCLQVAPILGSNMSAYSSWSLTKCDPRYAAF